MITAGVMILLFLGLIEWYLRRVFRNLALEFIGEDKPSDGMDLFVMVQFIMVAGVTVFLVNK